ncbi:MAG: sigma-54-dependent Fis family transcriptional regulator [Bdellovibrionaceae bacterium]|nr:sigma-54-dependent Fis family transcriptional regulator [Pseudobdellovibrionaceae bacterium]|tara:strand:- start:4548 stop:5702 length:1155 start_codon:yes stop_codon:yes gene_type:complete
MERPVFPLKKEIPFIEHSRKGKGALMSEIRNRLVGESTAIQSLLNTIDKISAIDSTVLISGESGTGKELVARFIHETSSRREKPLVIVNCGAIPSDMLEAELFGSVQGSMPGSNEDRMGRFEMANGGTIFLDEVGDLPHHLQVKLLRVLQTQQFEPVGSSRTIQVNVRIVAASNVNLEQAVQQRKFREDLYYRLNVIPVKIPSLRERKEDIKILIQHFIDRNNRLTGHNLSMPSGKVLEALLSYDWPGNVRELENLMERLVILKTAGSIEMEDLPRGVFQKYAEAQPSGTGAVSAWEYPKMALPEKGLDLKAVVSSFENHLVDQALSRTNGNKNKASELLRMNRTTLVEKLRKRGMITPAKKKRETLAAQKAAEVASSIFNSTE